jgi:predicted nucleic acid-binding protein
MELIDTDVLIDVQRGFAAAADWFATDPEVGVPGFVVMEQRRPSAMAASSTRSTSGTTACSPD